MRQSGDALFASSDLSYILRCNVAAAAKAVDALPPEDVLNCAVNDLVERVLKGHRRPILELSEGNSICQEPPEEQHMSGPPTARAASARGCVRSFRLPFKGDGSMFDARASSWQSRVPHGRVEGQELVLSFHCTNETPQQIKAALDDELSMVRQCIGAVNEDISQHNALLEGHVRDALTRRRSALERDRGITAALGYPVRRRENAPSTYALPLVRRKIAAGSPSVTPCPTPDPVFPDIEYEHVLNVVSQMVEVMERSPRAFAGLDEEALRFHFLVQLNGQYEGGATGETFNYEGKTDILVRHEGRVLLIAECKFWNGPHSLKEALAQLQKYTCWRDTKTAVILFNRDKDFTRVLGQIPEELRKHPDCEGEVEKMGESRFRVRLLRTDDPQLRLLVTVLAFNVPAVRSE